MSMLESALKWASQGYKIFPCKPNKKPYTSHGFYEASTSTDQINAWWTKYPEAGIGWWTTGYIVLDVDNKNGKVGFTSWERLQQDHETMPRTRTHLTGSHAGNHYIFKNPNGTKVGNIDLSEIYKDIDIRADKGYILLPPSPHESGYRYEVSDDAPIVDCPKWFVDLLINIGKKPPQPNVAVTEGEIIPPGSQDTWLFKRASSYRANGDSESTILTKLREDVKRCPAGDDPWTKVDLIRLAGSAGKYPPNASITTTGEKAYIVIDKKGNPSLDSTKMTVDIMTKTNFAFMRDNDTGFYYDGGVYKENAERFIAAECQRLVGITPVLTEHKITEIIGHIRRSNYHDRTGFNHDPNIINVKNGLLNIITGFLAQHTPEYLSNVQIPVKYVPGVDCPAIKQFLIDIHNPEDIPTMQELFGYLLTRDYRIQKSFLGVGGGENGKSTEQRLIESFIGKDNCSHKSWQQLENNRFASSALEGKAVNMFADLPSNGVDTTTTFKMLTGGDGIDAERKFKDSYSFLNFAKLIFSTNKPPKVENEDSYAFWRRWIILEYPRQFTDKDKKPNILQELTASSELSGLLNYALEGLKRLLVNNKFTYSRSVEDVTEYYMKAADPVYAFGAGNKCELDSNATVPKDALYDAFKAYCEQNKIPILKPNAFARALQNQIAFHVKSTRLTDSEGGRVQCWQGIKLSSVKDVNDNSHISLIADGRTEEVTKVEKNIDNPDNPDENPVFTCVCCGSHEFWYRGNNMEMVCWTCHPKPPEDNDEPNS